MKITINGMEITAHEGITILKAAERAGIYIPTLCHIRGRNSENPCGLCVVELEGSEQPVRSCDTEIREGMKLNTEVEFFTKPSELIIFEKQRHHNTAGRYQQTADDEHM